MIPRKQVKVEAPFIERNKREVEFEALEEVEDNILDYNDMEIIQDEAPFERAVKEEETEDKVKEPEVEPIWKSMQNRMALNDINKDFIKEEAPKLKNDDNENSIYIYWLDAYPNESTGQIFLLGKVKLAI